MYQISINCIQTISNTSFFVVFTIISFYNERTILVLVNTIELTAVKTALLIKDAHGLQYTFVIPAIAIFCSAVYAFLFMPETHGLTLKEIGKIYAEDGKEIPVSPK